MKPQYGNAIDWRARKPQSSQTKLLLIRKFDLNLEWNFNYGLKNIKCTLFLVDAFKWAVWWKGIQKNIN